MHTLISEDFEVFKKHYISLSEGLYQKEVTIEEPYRGKDKLYFIQLDDEEVVIATMIYFPNTSMKVDDIKATCFGYFEARNHPEGVKEMFKALKSQINDNEILFGPMNGSTWDNYRIAINLFQPSFPMDVSNPAYYPKLLAHAELEVAKSYASHIDKKFVYDKEKIQMKHDQLKAQGARIRNINLDDFDQELDKVYDLCMSSFTNSFLFSTIERKEFKSRYLAMKPYLQADYIWFVVDDSDDLKGMMFALSYPGPNNTKAYMAKTLARVPDKRYAGIGSVLSALLMEKAQEDGCSFGVHAFMEDKNVSNVLSGRFSGEPAKMYHLYKYQK